jgi:hypothetical protein
MNGSFVGLIAGILKYFCYIIMLLFTAGLVLSFIGRQTFILYTSERTYNSAIYSETNHNWTSRGLTVSLPDEIRVNAGTNGTEVDLITQVGLSSMYAINAIPLIVCFWFLSRVLNNVSKGRIFTEQNAVLLLYYGLIQIAVTLFIPLIKLFIVYLANQFTSSRIYMSTGQRIINDLIPSIAFIVAAYIIHYGVSLQDEVDHTL